MAYKEYKVLHIMEGGCGTIFLGSSGIPIKKLEAELNKEAADGWQLVFQTIEKGLGLEKSDKIIGFIYIGQIDGKTKNLPKVDEKKVVDIW